MRLFVSVLRPDRLGPFALLSSDSRGGATGAVGVK